MKELAGHLLQKFFHVQHARELVDEYGIVAGVFVGLYAAVEVSEFPFWHAVDDLMHRTGEFSFAGTKLTYQSYVWGVRPHVAPTRFPELSEAHSLDLLLVLLFIVLACIFGSIGVSKLRKKAKSRKS